MMNKLKYYIIAWLQGRKAATTFAIERQIGDLKKYDRRKERSWIYWNDKIEIQPTDEEIEALRSGRSYRG